MNKKEILHTCGHERIYAIDGILRYGATTKEGAEEILKGFVSHMQKRKCKNCEKSDHK